MGRICCTILFFIIGLPLVLVVSWWGSNLLLWFVDRQSRGLTRAERKGEK